MLIKNLLELQLLSAFKKLSTASGDLESAQRELAKDLATAIDSYIRSQTIIINPGQVVTTPTGPGVTSSPSAPATIS